MIKDKIDSPYFVVCRFYVIIYLIYSSYLTLFLITYDMFYFLSIYAEQK